MTRTARLTALLGLALFAVGGQARADSYTVTAAFLPTLTDFSNTVSVATFNPTLGTLTGISVTMTDFATFGGSVTNNGANAATFQASTTSNFLLTGTGVSLGDIFGSSGLTLSAAQNYTSLASGATASFSGTFHQTNVGGAGPVSVASANFGAYTGLNSTIPFTFASSSSITSGSNITSTLTTLATGIVSVTYTYSPTAVPEPASIAMMGMGLVGLVAVRRLRRRAIAA